MAILMATFDERKKESGKKLKLAVTRSQFNKLTEDNKNQINWNNRMLSKLHEQTVYARSNYYKIQKGSN